MKNKNRILQSCKSYNLTILQVLRSCLTSLTVFFVACGDWLDVVPDGVATLDMAFNSRVQTKKYLGSCYSFIPTHASLSSNPALLGCDEMWVAYNTYAANQGLSYNAYFIAQGLQSAVTPLLPGWNNMYQALRYCNTFLENAHLVPDLPEWERDQWMAEATVLKAYFYFCLVQMYGPVPIVRKNLPVDVDVSTVKVERETVDNCFAYIVELYDEAINSGYLLPFVTDLSADMGRITVPIAMALKAKALVFAASPLFNCNDEQATLRNKDDTQLFSQDKEKEFEKWQRAVVACKEAINELEKQGVELHEFINTGDRLTPTIATQLSLRQAFTERWNSDIIWANTQSIATNGSGGIIRLTVPKLDPQTTTSNTIIKYAGQPLKIAAMFYTKNGVPLEEDNTRDVSVMYNLRTATADERLFFREGRTTVDLNFDREPRFYAWVGFDGGIWYGAGRVDDTKFGDDGLYHLALKIGEIDGNTGFGNPTGYLPKKWIPVDAQITAVNTVSSITYPWPHFRMSDLYLLYAEAINELEGPLGANSSEMFKYIDKVRARAGLGGVIQSWNTYTNSQKYANQTGMREIIQTERMIELSFEGHRFWDIRRWKTAPTLYRTPIQGWNMNVSTTDGTASEVNHKMYTPQVLFEQRFSTRDYFWPIRNSDLDDNPNLVQNIGW